MMIVAMVVRVPMVMGMAVIVMVIMTMIVGMVMTG